MHGNGNVITLNLVHKEVGTGPVLMWLRLRRWREASGGGRRLLNELSITWSVVLAEVVNGSLPGLKTRSVTSV